MSRMRLGLVVSLVVGGACSGPSARSSGAVVSDSAGVEITLSRDFEDAPPLDFDPILTIGLAEGNSYYTFGRVAGGVLLSDGGAAVADGLAAHIRVFDASGTYRETWGGPGQGPGEFGVLWQVARYRGDSVIAAESGARRLTVFGPDGGFGRLLRPVVSSDAPGTRIAYSCCQFWGSTGRGDHLVSTPDRIPTSGGDPRWATLLLVALSPDGASIGSSSTLRGGEYRVALERPGGTTDTHLDTEARAAPTTDGFAATDGLAYEVRFFGPTGQLESIARLARSRRQVPESVRRSVEGHYARLLDRAGPSAEASGLTWVAERPFPDSLPAYNFLLSDHESRVWAGYLPSRFEEGGPRVDVFEVSGAFHGSLEFPSGKRLLDVRDDRVLVAVADEFGVERVRVLRLRG